MSEADESKLSQLRAASQPAPSTFESHVLVDELEARGFVVTAEKPRDRLVQVTKEPEGRIRFGVVSDTHLGHKQQQLTHLTDFYDRARAFGAEFMLHAGDMVDGQRMHRDQEFELHRHGVQAQGEYAAEHLPVLRSKRGKALPTYVIGGNHDGSGWNSAGANVFDVVTKRRSDVHFLGAPSATFLFGNLRIHMLHPAGGVSYARSYKLQKIVEGFEADDKPHILLVGHWHIQCHVSIRNVEAFALPCFQAQTAYLKTKGLMPVIGGYLMDVTYDADGLVSIAPQFVRYSVPILKDF